MICFVCHRRLTGTEMLNRVEWRLGPDGAVRLYGEGAPDGSLREAVGTLQKLSHGKCYHVQKKQRELAEARAADAPSQPPSDWRYQDVVDVEELGGEGNRADRGTGAAG